MDENCVFTLYCKIAVANMGRNPFIGPAFFLNLNVFLKLYKFLRISLVV